MSVLSLCSLCLCLRRIFFFRVSLVDKCGDHLLHYPVIERDGYVEGPVIAVAKCKQGTAAWQSFHCSHLLRSDRHPDRCCDLLCWSRIHLISCKQLADHP